MKAVMLSIRPAWCEKIAQGKKTVEIRKTRPKIDTPFKCIIYCTKGFPVLFKDGEKVFIANSKYEWLHFTPDMLNGKVIGEFVCDRIDEYTNYSLDEQAGHIKRREDLLRSACMTLKDWRDYIGSYRSDFGYAWHISELVIYDTPRPLYEFFVKCNKICEDCDWWESVKVNADEFDMDCTSPLCGCKPLKRPPQSWCYVED